MSRNCENEECNDVVVRGDKYTAIVSKEAYNQYSALQPQFKKKADKAFNKFFIDDSVRATMDLKIVGKIPDKEKVINVYSIRIDQSYRAGLLFYTSESNPSDAKIVCVFVLTHAEYDKHLARM